MSGFEFMYRLCGAGPTIKQVIVAGNAGAPGTVHKGDIVTLASGSVSAGGPEDTNYLGLCLANAVAGADIVRVPVIVDPDVVLACEDASARVIGATLDLKGASGAQGLDTSEDKNFVVVEDKRSDEKTKVRFNVGMHHYNTGQ